MRLILEIKTGEAAGRRFVLPEGPLFRVGRYVPADVVVRDDPMLSNLHFALLWDGAGWRLRDLKSYTGTRLNGGPVDEAAVGNGDTIVAGRTTFSVRLEEAASAAPTPVPAPASAPPAPAPVRAAAPVGPPPVPPQDLGRLLRTLPEPLFALLDAARDPRVLEVLRASRDEYQSLYEGAKGAELADFAPYLVRLPPQSALLEVLVRQGWGRSWGVYLTCAQPFAEVRKHFRRFLLVKAEDGRELYFRFYDPRVLRIFLPTCTAQETAELFGPVGSYLMEAEEPHVLLQFTKGGRGAERKALAVPAGQAPTAAAKA
jgi:pSer/pThr/pTyr-binding forkhead associated (FHA) protein